MYRSASLPASPSTDAILTDHANKIRRLRARVLADIIEIGRSLTECRKILDHGQWLPWLEREFGWSEATTRNFMRVFELSEAKSANFADFGDLPTSSLYPLAAPSTPDEARDEILERAGNGECISGAEVKAAIAAAKQKTTRAASAIPFAWFSWSRSHSGPTKIDRI